jgi:hypothetical protein
MFCADGPAVLHIGLGDGSAITPAEVAEQNRNIISRASAEQFQPEGFGEDAVGYRSADFLLIAWRDGPVVAVVGGGLNTDVGIRLAELQRDKLAVLLTEWGVR